MKKILITGAGSYIGGAFEQLTARFAQDYSVDTLDVQTPAWEEYDFSGYDALLHVAAIVHQKETEELLPLYDRVNCRLALQIAEKAKAAGVGQFVFMSTMAVYGTQQGEINGNTPLSPKTAYGRSKLQAEEGLRALETETFAVAVVRPPMVYGKGCRGNYVTLSKLAKKLPVFPALENRRSMIYIENLCEFLRCLIDRRARGIFHPQNAEYVCTADMVQRIARLHGRKLPKLRLLDLPVRLLRGRIGMARKAFGDLWYADELRPSFPYPEISFEESLKRTEL